ncbi:MAG: ABC transporter substrate-binding protein [Gammaproteobacteria bacterium]|nr:ABC transporter substrate-binding protein [Gammaproteobacteria bacterium]
MFLRISGLILWVALAACSGSDDVTNSNALVMADQKVFRYAMNGAPTSLDPVQSGNVYANVIVSNVFDTLYTYKYLARPPELKPSLAEAMPEVSEDGLIYTIRLKHAVLFADDPAFAGGKGREVTAADIVYSIKRHFDPATRPQGAWLWQGRIKGLDAWKEAGSDYALEVEGLRALDRYTLRIELTKPYPQLLYTLAMGFSAVVPAEAVAVYGREFGIRPVGSGAFRLQSFNTAKAVLVRNHNYRQQPFNLKDEGYNPKTQAYTRVEKLQGRSPPFLDRLEIDFIQEGSALWNSFTKGNEVQMAGLPDEQVKFVLASTKPVVLKQEFADKYKMTTGPEAGFVYSNFNLDFPEMGYNADPERNQRNKALRCAVIRGFDWEARNNSFYMGLGQVFPGVIPPVVPEFDPDMSAESITRDVAYAKQLLAANDWTAESLPTLVYGTVAGVKSRLFFEQFRAFLKDIGYPQEKVVLKRYATFGDMVRAWSRSELPFVSKGWGLDYPDAENTLQLFYGPNGSPGSNDANYANPKYDALFEEASVMPPSAKRTVIYRQMNQMLVDDCVALTGLTRMKITLWHNNVIAVPDSSIVAGNFLRYVDID